MNRSPERNFLLVTVIIVAVILHGSLYPYDFTIPSGDIGPFGTLIHSWAKRPTSFGDVVANIVLYMPFGFFATLALRPRLGRLGIVTLAGMMLSVMVELTQFYDVGRDTEMSDVYANTLGSLLGAIGGSLIHARSRWPLLSELSVRPVPCLLLIAMLGYHLFPYVPTIDLHKYWNSLKPVLLYPSLAPYPTLRYFALWLTVSYLIAAAMGGRYAWFAIASFMAFVFGAKIVITGLSVTVPELVGAATALAVFPAIGRTRAAPFIVGSILCAMIVALRLEPFSFEAVAHPFSWLPFRSYLVGSLEINTASFFEKFFLYGSLVWIGSETGLSLWKATVLAAALLFATSLAETHLPNRSAEITDAIITLVSGVIIATMNRFVREREATPRRPAPVPR